MVFYLLVRVVVTVLVLGLVVAVVMLLTPQPRPPELCRSHSCMQYAERLLQSMNTSADPCDSFTRFVCSGWTEHNVLSVHLSMLDSALSRLSRFARSASASLSHPRTAAQIGAAFFHSCDVVIRDNRNEMANVRRALAEAGVAWPGRAIGKPDALHTLLFAAIHLGWTAILHVDIRPGSRAEPPHISPSSSRQTDTVVLTLSREFGMLARKRSSQQARRQARITYVGLLNDNLGSGGDDVSASAAYEVANRVDSEFLDPLASIVGDRTARTTALENSTIFKGRPALATRWRDALSSYGVPAAHDVLLRNDNSDFVRTLIEIWESNGEAETHMFVSWCIVQVAALFASQRLINSFYESEQHARVLHGVFCLAHTYLLTGFELFAGYSAEVSHAGAREDADALVRAVRGEFYRLLARWPHRDSNVTVVADWNSTAVAFSAVDRTSPESGVGSVASGGVWSGQPVAMGDSLVTNWRLAAAAARVVSRSPQRAAVAESIQALVFHANVGKDFLLLPYAFSYPLYDEDAARALNYAGMGSQVAQALGELFLAAYRSSSPPAREPILEFMHCVQPDASSARRDESQMMQGACRGRRQAARGARGADAAPAVVRGRLLRKLSRRRPAVTRVLHSRSTGSVAGGRAPLRRHVAADEGLRAHFRVRSGQAYEHRRRRVQPISLRCRTPLLAPVGCKFCPSVEEGAHRVEAPNIGRKVLSFGGHFEDLVTKFESSVVVIQLSY